MARARNTRSREERRADIRAKLMTATEQLIANGESYAAVPIERLATEAGVSRATFYIYFDSKGDLLRHALDEAARELNAAAAPWFALDGTATPADMQDVILAVLRAFRPHGPLMAAVADESTQDGGLRDHVDELLRAVGDRLVVMIEQGQADGWIDPELLPAETAVWMLWLMERGLTQLVAKAEEARLPQLAATLADMAWHTLRK